MSGFAHSYSILCCNKLSDYSRVLTGFITMAQQKLDLVDLKLD